MDFARIKKIFHQNGSPDGMGGPVWEIELGLNDCGGGLATLVH
jgi:hypothetical protein